MRIKLPGLGQVGQVAPELLERLVRAFGILRRDALRAAHVLECSEQCVARRDLEREEQVLGGDVLVLEPAHLLLGAIEDAREVGRRLRLLRRALHRRLLRKLRLALGAERLHRLACPLDERPRQLLVEEGDAEVLGVDLGITAPARELLCGCDRLPALDR